MSIGKKKVLHDKSKEEPLQAEFIISREPIQENTCVKDLNVQIGNHLKWKNHVKLASSKVVRDIGKIRYALKFLPIEILNLLYHGLIEPHVRYCCSILGRCRASTCCFLEKLQNRAIRIITGSPYDAPTEPLLRRPGLPNIQEMVYKESASMVYKAVRNKAPIYRTTLFNRVSSVTNRTLPSSKLNVRSPWLKIKHGQNCFAHMRGRGHGLELIIKWM